jgi:PAS domain-containing protein
MSNLTPGWQKTSVLESVFDQLSDALVLYDAEYRITGVNKAAERLFGMSGEEMLGKHCQQIFQCSVCEPNCGVLVGLNQSPTNSNSTVRLHTATAWSAWW